MKRIYLLGISLMLVTGLSAQRISNPPLPVNNLKRATLLEKAVDMIMTPGDNYGKLYEVNPIAPFEPTALLGISAIVDIANIDTSGFLTSFTFSAPVTVAADSFFVGFEMSTTAGDTIGAVSSTDGEFSGYQRAFDMWSDNSWHPFNDGTPQTWELDVDLAIFPVITTGPDTLGIVTFFTTYTPVIYSATPSGYVVGTNSYGDKEKAQKYGFTGGTSVSAILVWFAGKTEHIHIGINEETAGGVKLYQNFPNPANDYTFVKYSLSQPSNVSVDVFDITGKKVMTVDKGYQSAADRTMMLNTSELPDGLYHFRLNTGEVTISKRLIVVH